MFEGYYGTEESPLEQWKGFNEVITKTIDICCNDVSFNGNLTGDNAIIHDISLINVYAKTGKISAIILFMIIYPPLLLNLEGLLNYYLPFHLVQLSFHDLKGFPQQFLKTF